MRIVVINPNSSAEVTAEIAAALAPLGDCFEVLDRPDGPATIRTDADVAEAGRAFAARIADWPALWPQAAGFITACFSDPGLELARAAVDLPVTGAQEAAVLEACDRAERFGVIALSEQAIPRHLTRIEALGCRDRLVAELPLKDVSAADSGRDPQVYGEILRLAETLRARGAGAIVLGCAGMAGLVARLEADLALPVIDPVAAAGRLALIRAGAFPPAA
ncbi:aspartate/glutamate racemase family protein [Pseudodonghicola flavimaris]|uniref:Aspartate/glutamate racemase family protein n=1 Tax=Pseudodonghicola flavimaris TaxID=3050036 RepID=A0ABT7F2N7_9RHOB|nr:aspartate/glutamate racemase family protein [Pseudodonghicola flavimaris]MDK3018871.1 aspartate/glutamate racemase family protein [Pseudodonghicola flavimaris]